MTVDEFTDILRSKLPFEPNSQQSALIGALGRFCSDAVGGESVFLINGYAGTGKTSIIGALVKTLADVHIPSVLLAPTGRAAKVFSSMASRPAYTIHRRIYRMDSAGRMDLTLNNTPFTVFIVDEASMIGNERDSGGSTLLDDLLQHVFAADNCKLILLGDSAQLPPVGCEVSPAMDVATLKKRGLRVSRAVITDTVRQDHNSDILRNATRLRRSMLLDPLPEPRLIVDRHDDVVSVSPEDLPDAIAASYSAVGKEEAILITRSNRRATDFNLAIRRQIFDYEENLVRGERLLVAKNNYHWSSKVKGLDFIANGDIAIIDRIIATEDMGPLHFADVALTLPDRGGITIEAKIITNTLVLDTPCLPANDMAALMQHRLNIIAPGASESAAMRALRSDPYVNALQVKYGYAVTCHKAQGGQWSDVFVDMSYIPPEAMGLDFYRWLYTATTRATRRLHYIGINNK